MANKITLKAQDGSTVEFYDEIRAQGGVKDVYFSTDKTYVVAFYRKKLSPSDKNRLENIVGPYHKRIFETVDGKYWKDSLIMPDRLVDWDGKIGVVLPFYPSKYFFKGGPFDGKEKEGKWFASAKLLQKSEMRKNMVMDLIYRGFINAANYSESHYNPRRSQIKTELRYLFVTTPNR